MAGKPGVAIRSKKYEKFRGVDFSTDPALVDDARSPWAPNMIADMGGMPEKRPGWRTIVTLAGKVNGVFNAEFGGERHLLAHVGTRLYRWYEAPYRSEEEPAAPVELASGLADARSTSVFMGSSLWIFTGTVLLRYNGTTCTRASENAYVPLTVISRDPAGGGTTYESVNMLTGKQKIGFLADGTSAAYTLPYSDIESVDEVEVNGSVVTTGYSINLADGIVTFNTAPAAPTAGAEDNVFITFTKTIAGYADRINKCTAAIVWGAGAASDRIIATGNSDYPNLDYICGYADGSYWPDTGYSVIGTTETKILGYRRLGEYLAIIKEDNGQDSTVFLRTSYIDSDGAVSFSAKPCLAGAGAVTRFGFGNINDEQLILTGNGVFALTTNSLTAERIAQNRSFRVDPKLLTEPLTEAVTCSWDGCYLVFVGGRVYGLDGRQPKSFPSRNDTSFLYECFYWENVPARCVMRMIDEGAETLYFGTDDGRICKFNTDVETMDRFSDDGAAIESVWATKSDDDGNPMVLKTLLKKGSAVTIKPYTRSSAKVLFRTEKDVVAWQVAEDTRDIFSWEDIDFSRFTFDANDAPAEIPFRRKVKNYKRLQILIKNDAVNEGFGVFCIVKHYVTGNFAKK